VQHAQQRKAIRLKESFATTTSRPRSNRAENMLYLTPFKYYNPNIAIISNVKTNVDRFINNAIVRLVVLRRSIKIFIESVRRMSIMSRTVNHITTKRKKHQSTTAIRLLLSQKVLRKKLRYLHRHYPYHYHYNNFNCREKHNHIVSVMNSGKARRYVVCLQQLVYFKKLKTCFVAITSLRKMMIMIIKAYRGRIKKTKVVKETAHIYHEHYAKKAKHYFIKR